MGIGDKTRGKDACRVARFYDAEHDPLAERHNRDTVPARKDIREKNFVISTAVNAIVGYVFGIGDLPAEHPPRHADGCGGADRLWHRPGVWTRAAGARPVPVDARVR